MQSAFKSVRQQVLKQYVYNTFLCKVPALTDFAWLHCALPFHTPTVIYYFNIQNYTKKKPPNTHTQANESLSHRNKAALVSCSTKLIVLPVIMHCPVWDSAQRLRNIKESQAKHTYVHIPSKTLMDNCTCNMVNTYKGFTKSALRTAVSKGT